MKNLMFLFVAIAGLMLTSCRKDVSPPTLSLSSPAQYDIVAQVGDTILFQGTFTDPCELGYLEMTANYDGDGSNVIRTFNEMDAKKEHTINEIYIIGDPYVAGDVISVGFIGYDVPGNNTIDRVSITIE